MAIKVGMVSLGCSKNQVDAEILLALMLENGYEICADPQQCDVVIINTCGFIEDAKKESIETIFEFAQLKNEGQVKVLVVTGCLAERYQDQLVSEIPEADVVLGIGKNTEIAKAVKEALDGHRVSAFGDKADLPLNGDRVLSTEKYSAYLKIAEGCDNRCSFCAIPLIRGGYRSRRMEDILEEARGLAESGVKELNLVAQDTTKYGQDLYGEYALDKLLTRAVQDRRLPLDPGAVRLSGPGDRRPAGGHGAGAEGGQIHRPAPAARQRQGAQRDEPQGRL